MQTNGNVKRANEFLHIPVAKTQGRQLHSIRQLVDLARDAEEGAHAGAWFHLPPELTSSTNIAILSTNLMGLLSSRYEVSKTAYRVGNHNGTGNVDSSTGFAHILERLLTDFGDQMFWNAHHMQPEAMTSAYLRYIQKRASFLLPNQTKMNSSLSTFHASTYFNVYNIVVHVRKGDIMTSSPGSKYFRRMIHDFDVLRLLTRLLALHPDAIFHLCYNKPFSSSVSSSGVLSHRPLDEFRAALPRLVLHEDEQLSTEWPGMVNADILVAARSSYSGLPALFNTKEVWHPLSRHESEKLDLDHDGRLDAFGRTFAYYAGTPPNLMVNCTFISEIVKLYNAPFCRDLWKADLQTPLHVKPPMWT